MSFHTRRLPHLYAVGRPIFLTWRLFGSLPPNRSFPAAKLGKSLPCDGRILDNAHASPLYLRQPEIAGMMVEALRYREDVGHYGVTGQPFWQDESYDRLGRDGREFARIARYIEMNPVKAGLVASPEAFPWSSAGPIASRPQVSNLPH